MKSSKNNLLVPFSPLNTQEFYFKIFLAVVPKSASCLLLYWYVPLHYFLFSPSASSFIILPPLIKSSLFPCASFFSNFALFILSPPLPLPSPFLLYPSSENRFFLYFPALSPMWICLGTFLYLRGSSIPISISPFFLSSLAIPVFLFIPNLVDNIW